MPEIQMKHIVSFSSEEQSHKAENLLNNDVSRKWKCAVGEKQASIVVQLEKSTQLSSIDIGNDGSAFVEILVGRSSNDNVQYQVLLVASSFMSPQESRQGVSPNRVRIFDKDKLAPEVASQKWDLVKVVCTQPFNKRIAYGLSFVKFHTLSGDVEDVKTEPQISKPVDNADKERRKSFGSFKLREEKSESDNSFTPGMQMAMYNMAKKENMNISLNQLRNISSVEEARALIKQHEDKKESQQRSRSPISTSIEEKRRKLDKPTATANPAKGTPVKFDTLKHKRVEENTSKTPHKPASPKGATSSARKSTSKKKVTQPFDQILRGVNFAISGFQNPLRSQVRDKALRMGAQYRKDWTADSTHLVCAFPNTPKFRQVMGCGGKIVRKEWIEDCTSRKQLLSWKKYSMDPNQSEESSSEEEPEVEEVKEEVSSKDEEEKLTTDDGERERADEEEDDPYGASTDEEGGDTEDEIEKIKAQQAEPDRNDVKPPKDNDDDDIYNASTDEEPQGNGGDLPSLPDYFTDKDFLLYGDFDSDKRRLLRRHIIACGGKVSEYMGNDVEYIVTEQPWDNNFDQALGQNASLTFVKPAWVFQCGLQQRIVPCQPYVVSPS